MKTTSLVQALLIFWKLTWDQVVCQTMEELEKMAKTTEEIPIDPNELILLKELQIKAPLIKGSFIKRTIFGVVCGR